MRTPLFLLTGFLLLAAFFILGKQFSSNYPAAMTTATVAFVILQTGFTANRQGYAAAMAIVMLLIVATASAVALRLLQRREVDL